MDSTTVTSKGQVTIPKHVRKRFGIRQGTQVQFRVAGSRVELHVLSHPAEVRKSGFGLLKSRRRAAPPDFDPASLAKR